MKVVDIRNLKKYYGNVCGVEDVSFSIKEGEIFGFIGPNGSGKSTTIRCMLGLLNKDDGAIEIFGKDPISYRVEILEQVGYLPSEVHYYEKMTVEELLKYSASFYKHDFRDSIKQLSSRLELDLKRQISQLSYGNKKKVGIIQALLHRPKLLILDEPTSGLDPLMQQAFFDIIKEENRNGMSVLFSSHVLSEVKNLSNVVGVIREGRMVEINTIDEMTLHKYKTVRIYSSQETTEQIASLDFVEEYERRDGMIEFIYSGNADRLLADLRSFSIDDITIENPSLEELFIQYYKEE